MVLDLIAASTAAHLQRGGYLADTEVKDILSAYNSSLMQLGSPRFVAGDFLHFLAQHQAKKHGIPMEGEIKRMHKLLHGQLNDSVFYWSLGQLPGRALTFYEQCPSLRGICELLLCPSVFAGEENILHVAALNPVAGLVAAEWIRHDYPILEQRDEPFIYLFMMEFLWWDAMQHRHFRL